MKSTSRSIILLALLLTAAGCGSDRGADQVGGPIGVDPEQTSGTGHVNTGY
jgi:hypothetical protein